MQHLSRLLVLSAALSVAAASQAADPVRVTGTTTGSFSGAFNPHLTFTNGSFDTLSDSNGDFSFGNTGVATDSLGLFTLTNPTVGSETFGGAFHATVTFTMPAAIGGVFTANISGTVFDVPAPGGSSVKIKFTNPNQTFNFIDALGHPGTLTLHLIDVSIGRPPVGGQSIATLTGDGNVAVAPAPGAIAAFGFGILANVRRRRRSA